MDMHVDMHVDTYTAMCEEKNIELSVGILIDMVDIGKNAQICTALRV